MPFDLSLELEKSLFIWGVLIIVVVHRPYIDRSYRAIGGKLSSAFRKLLGVAVSLNAIRFVASMNGPMWPMLLSDRFGIAEVVGLSFLCFYVRKRLQDRINIGG
jgi:hypothetical protein